MSDDTQEFMEVVGTEPPKKPKKSCAVEGCKGEVRWEYFCKISGKRYGLCDQCAVYWSEDMFSGDSIIRI